MTFQFLVQIRFDFGKLGFSVDMRGLAACDNHAVVPGIAHAKYQIPVERCPHVGIFGNGTYSFGLFSGRNCSAVCSARCTASTASLWNLAWALTRGPLDSTGT